MNETTPQSPLSESQQIKAEIARFLSEDRLQPKLEKLKADDNELRQKLVEEHLPATWIADAAHRVGQIQQVTHAIKFTHPSADGSSLSTHGNPVADTLELGTHILGSEWSADVVGNAAALDVYKFLRLAVDGRTLLDRAIACDAALAKALSDDADQAKKWMAAFATLPEPKDRPASHKLAKQIYWPLGSGAYHLLAPLLSSPVAHAIYKRIYDDRFSDAAKAAREARRTSKPHPHGYREYPNFAIQSFGGSKPQNISQLNSDRRGNNYLLASIPPVWKSAPLRPPFKTDTVFARYFGNRPEVKRLVVVLKDFLDRVADAGTNVRVRETRSELVADLCGEALHMSAELRSFMDPGWSGQRDCQLNVSEQCWLDPARARTDEDFATNYHRGEWQDDVCLRFANWLNTSLKTDKILLGGPAAVAWQSALKHELNMLREELDDK